jgi:hypothetical protein
MPMFVVYITETRTVERHAILRLEAATKLAAKSEAYDLAADEDERIEWNRPSEFDSDRDLEVDVEELAQE